jgi:hypothetical protein
VAQLPAQAVPADPHGVMPGNRSVSMIDEGRRIDLDELRGNHGRGGATPAPSCSPCPRQSGVQT